MPHAVGRIVDTYVQLDKRQGLEDLLLHRQRLALNFKARTGYDFSEPLRQVEYEIAIIEAGLNPLAGAAQVA